MVSGSEKPEDVILLVDELPPDVPWPPPTPPPPPRPRRPAVLIPVLLFLATCASTLYVGGWEYAVAMMTILVCHEAGHYIQARRYRVPATLPYFLPMPLLPFGTLGAVIGMDARVRDRRALFDIGISGPLAGLVPTVVCCLLGLQWSKVRPAASHESFLQLGEPLLFQFFSYITFGPIPPGHDVFLHGVGVAGWVGLLITALNLVPIGQLDGGHVLYALLRHRANLVATLLLISAIVAAVLLRYGSYTLMLILLVLMGPGHPPTTDDNARLGPLRIVLGWLVLAFVVVGFTPQPLKFNLP